ncbi:MAG: cell division protein SepF [Ruminococcaceae bacterium]|nr:cell division protein SepF [Oscillospiraceae bacterium]
MSLWDSMKKFAQPYSEDEYEDYEDEAEGFEEAPEERPARARRSSIFGNAPSEEAPAYSAAKPTGTSAFSGQVVNMGGKQEVVLFHPTSFGDASKAADDLRSRRAVIVNMENVDKAMARRVADFLSGCTYAIDGSVKKVAQSTYLFCPHNMEIVGDLENLPTETETPV